MVNLPTFLVGCYRKNFLCSQTPIFLLLEFWWWWWCKVLWRAVYDNIGWHCQRNQKKIYTVKGIRSSSLACRCRVDQFLDGGFHCPLKRVRLLWFTLWFCFSLFTTQIKFHFKFQIFYFRFVIHFALPSVRKNRQNILGLMFCRIFNENGKFGEVRQQEVAVFAMS